MSLILPNPNSPKNGDPLDATVVYQNQTAITQSIQSFDASQIQAGTLSNHAAFSAALDPQTRMNETSSGFVSSGCTWSIVSGLQGTMAGGVVYIQGIRIPVTGVGSYTFTANQDTYVDIDYNGNVYYVPVANGATTGMTLTTNSIRVAKVVTGSSAVTSIAQIAANTIGSLIYPSGSTSSKSMQIPYKFAAYNNTTQSVNAGNTKVTLNSRMYDTGNNFDATTNYRFTAAVAGFYSFNGGVNTNPYNNSVNYAMIYKNGTEVRRGVALVSSTVAGSWQSTVRIDNLAMQAGDYVELWFYESGGGGQSLNNGYYCTYLEGYLAGTS